MFDDGRYWFLSKERMSNHESIHDPHPKSDDLKRGSPSNFSPISIDEVFQVHPTGSGNTLSNVITKRLVLGAICYPFHHASPLPCIVFK